MPNTWMTKGCDISVLQPELSTWTYSFQSQWSCSQIWAANFWDINPETQKEEIPDIDELENNELLVDEI